MSKEIVLKKAMVSIRWFILVVMVCGIQLKGMGQKTELYRNPIKHYNLGLEYFEKEKYSAAQKEFEKVAQYYDSRTDEIAINSEYLSALCAIQLFHRDASLLLREFIRNHPESPKVKNARYQLGIYHFRKREWDKVIDWLEQVDPYDLNEEDNYNYHFKLGYAYMRKKQMEKASRLFYEIKDVNNPYTSPARYYFAHIAYLDGKYETALQDFKKLEQHPKFGPLVPYYLTQILYNQKKYDELIEYAEPKLDSVIEKRKPEVARLIGEAYYYKRDYEQALPYLEMYAKESRMLNNDDRYQLAFTYYKTENYEEASKLFNRLIGLDNEMAQLAAYHLADCFLKLDQKAFSRGAFRKAYDLGFDDDINEDALFNYARLSYEVSLDPTGKSVEAFKEYIEKYPKSRRLDEAYRYLIAVYLTTRNYDAALHSIEQVKNKTPNLKEAYQKIAYNKAIMLYQDKEYKESISYFDRSHRYRSDGKLSALGFYWKGEARFRMKEYENAIENYQTFIFQPAAILTGKFNEANYNIGYSHFKKEQFGEAITWFRKFIYDKNETDSLKINDAYLRIGDCYFMTRDYSFAIDFYRQAADIGRFDADYALFQTSICQGLQKDLKGKVATLERLVAHHEGSTHLDAAYYEMGRAYNILGNNDKALESFNTVIETSINDNVYRKRALKSSALIYFNQNQADQAVTASLKIIEDYPTFEDTREALSILESIYIERGQIAEYRKLLAELPFMDVAEATLDSTVFAAAEMKYGEQKYDAAVVALKQYLNQFSPAIYMLKANYYLADSYFRSEDYDSSITYYEAIAAFPPNGYSEEAVSKSADYWFLKKDYEKALPYYTQLEKVATNAPNIRKSVEGQLDCSYKLNQRERAVKAAHNYLEYEFEELHYYTLAHLITGRDYMRRGISDSALYSFQLVSDTVLNEIGAEAKYNLARIHYDRDSLKLAEKEIFELINQTPSYKNWLAQSFLLLADIYEERDDFFQAKAVLNSMIENYADDPALLAQAKERLENLETKEKQQQEEEEQETPEVELDFDDVEISDDEIDELFGDDEEVEDIVIPETEKEDTDGN
ncbi:tetratricopeptide repeat protein [bacterium SCSIO 12741]|nr:tetratricopeptide repeat protein [bacterium SCSIO 12741]